MSYAVSAAAWFPPNKNNTLLTIFGDSVEAQRQMT